MFQSRLSRMIQIVPLTENRVLELAEFFKRNKFEYFNPHGTKPSEIKAMLERDILDYYYILETTDGFIVGYGMLRGWDEGFSIPTLGIAIDRYCQGIGLGTMFIQFLHAVARNENCDQIRIGVMKGNDYVKSLYEKLGYEFTEDLGDREYGYLKL